MSEINDLNKPLREVAVEVLREVALDKTAPAAARGAAARSIAEICGLLGKLADGAGDIERKGLTELTLAEIDAELARLTPGGSVGIKKS